MAARSLQAVKDQIEADVAATVATLQTGLNAARSDLRNAEGLIPDTSYGVYRPLFTDATTGLTSPSGLTTASGGGIIASVAGTAGTAFIELPATCDYTKPWRSAVLFQCDSANDANYCKVVLGHGAVGDADAGNKGISCEVTGGYIRVLRGGSQVLFQAMPTVLNEKYWVGASSDGVRTTVFVMPYNHSGIMRDSGLGDGNQHDAYVSSLYDVAGFSGTFNAFNAQARIKIDTKATGVRILGVYFNMAGVREVNGQIINPSGWAGGPDARMQPPALIEPVYESSYDGALVRIPKAYDGHTPIDLIYVDHPNASDEIVHARSTDTDAGVAMASLLNAGYMLAYRRGDSASYTGQYSSPWGGVNGLARRKEMIDDLRARLPMIRHIYWLGLSMGCVDGLRMHMLYPTLLRALVGVSGVTNLTYAYSNEGFSSQIDTGWGSPGLPTISAGDPNLNASSFSSLPIAIWHGDADTTIHKTNHADLFKTNVQAAGGSVTVTTVAGAGHLTSASLFDGPAIKTFLASV